MELTTVTLDNLGHGAARELFERELTAVLENILDPNTPPTAKRSITLKVVIQPEEDRGAGTVQVSCTSKVAATKTYGTRIFMGFGPDGAIAREVNPATQKSLFEDQLKSEAQGQTAAFPKEAKDA